MNSVVIDWPRIADLEGFYSAVLPHTGAPTWHGHNLDAIQDSWITGDICSGGPPFTFVFRGCKDIKSHMQEFSESVVEIASESVRIHGGNIVHEKECQQDDGANDPQRGCFRGVQA